MADLSHPQVNAARPELTVEATGLVACSVTAAPGDRR